MPSLASRKSRDKVTLRDTWSSPRRLSLLLVLLALLAIVLGLVLSRNASRPLHVRTVHPVVHSQPLPRDQPVCATTPEEAAGLAAYWTTAFAQTNPDGTTVPAAVSVLQM